MLLLPLVFYFPCLFLCKSMCCVLSLLACQLYRVELANSAQILLGFLFWRRNHWFRSSILIIFWHFSFFFLSMFWRRWGTVNALSQMPDIIQAHLSQLLQTGRDLRTKNHFLQFFFRSWSCIRGIQITNFVVGGTIVQIQQLLVLFSHQYTNYCVCGHVTVWADQN